MSTATVKQSYAGRFIFTYLAYTLFGVLCLGLSYQVDHVSPFYLPAGIALAVMLVWGVSMWPAVALGCGTVAVLARVIEQGAVAPNVWILAAVCGLGGAAQAGLGVALVRRFVSQPLTLEEPRDIAWFLFLGGPVATLLNSGLAAGVVELLHMAPEAGVWGVFLTWWCGDTLGVLIAAPSPRTCSTTAPTCARCRCCWGIRTFQPRRSTPTWRASGSSSCMPSTTRAGCDRFGGGRDMAHRTFQRRQLMGAGSE